MEANVLDPGEKYQEPWPSPDDFVTKRQQYLEWNKKRFVNLLNNNSSTFHFNDQQKDYAASLMCNLLFGAQIVEERTGEYLTENIQLITSPTNNYQGDPFSSRDHDEAIIGYAIETDSYVIRSDWFRDLVISQTQPTSRGQPRLLQGHSIEDFFLLAGVEEGAHAAFNKLKSQEQREKALDIIKNDHRNRASSNHERRALLWKKAVVSRYFPKYKKEYETAYKRHGFGQAENQNIFGKAIKFLHRKRHNS